MRFRFWRRPTVQEYRPPPLVEPWANAANRVRNALLAVHDLAGESGPIDTETADTIRATLAPLFVARTRLWFYDGDDR